MTKKDLKLILVIGAAVGLLCQPILTNLVHGSAALAKLFGTSELSLNVRIIFFLIFFICAPLALWILSVLSRIVPVLYQFGKFAAVGTLNSFIDVGILNVEILLSGVPSGGAYYPIFKGISFLSGTTNSFFWNKYWTFKAHEKKTVSETAKFYVFATVGFALNVGAATLVVHFHPASNLWANAGALAGIAASFFWDFVAYKYFVFKKIDH